MISLVASEVFEMVEVTKGSCFGFEQEPKEMIAKNKIDACFIKMVFDF